MEPEDIPPPSTVKNPNLLSWSAKEWPQLRRLADRLDVPDAPARAEVTVVLPDGRVIDVLAVMNKLLDRLEDLEELNG